MLFCCLLVVIYFIFMYYGILNNSYNMKLTAYFLLLISCFITIVNGVINFYQSPDKYTPFKDMVRKTLLAFFERLNKKYNDQGLSFIVHDNHYWIEIKIKKDVADKWRAQNHWQLEADDDYDTEDEKEEYWRNFHRGIHQDEGSDPGKDIQKMEDEVAGRRRS